MSYGNRGEHQMKNLLRLIIACGIGALLVSSAFASEQDEVSRRWGNSQPGLIVEENDQPITGQMLSPPYDGHLRVYIVEPVSRWYDSWFYSYDNGFLNWAIDEPISISFEGSYKKTVIWDGKPFGFGDITEQNIRAIAVVTNSQPNVRYSNPPNGAPYNSYFVDAAAGANPGSTGYDSEEGGFTHTVFID